MAGYHTDATKFVRNIAFDLQYNEGLADPPSKDVFMLAIVWWPSPPPQAKSRNTCGKPPARSVKPVLKLCFRFPKSTLPRVSATFPSSAAKLNPTGPQSECSKLSRSSRRFGARKR